MKRLFYVFLITAVLVTNCIVVFGVTNMKSISVSPNTATVTVNGVKISSDNFNYNGSIYVPLRAVSENMGAKVLWNQNSKTASITTLSDKDFNAHVYTEMMHEYFVLKDYTTILSNLETDYEILGIAVDLTYYMDFQDQIITSRNEFIRGKEYYLSATDENVPGFYEHINNCYSQLLGYYDQLYIARKSFSKVPGTLSINIVTLSGDISDNEKIAYENYQHYYF
jgi:hypothetical protein